MDLEQSQNVSTPFAQNVSGLASSVSSSARNASNTNALQSARTLYDDELVRRNWKARRSPSTIEPSQDKQSTAAEIEIPKDTGIVRIPPPIIEVPREVKLQEWEGQVQEVRDSYYTARLVDLTTRDLEETKRLTFLFLISSKVIEIF